MAGLGLVPTPTHCLPPRPANPLPPLPIGLGHTTLPPLSPPLPQVWKKGVDSEVFHPRFRSAAMRERLTGGQPDRPTLVYVGRLGFEKNLFFLREVLQRNPGVGLAFVGDGPARQELQAAFKGTPTQFLGMLHVSAPLQCEGLERGEACVWGGWGGAGANGDGAKPDPADSVGLESGREARGCGGCGAVKSHALFACSTRRGPASPPHLQGEDLSAAYASSDIFVMPSESETLGFVVLEVSPRAGGGAGKAGKAGKAGAAAAAAGQR